MKSDKSINLESKRNDLLRKIDLIKNGNKREECRRLLKLVDFFSAKLILLQRNYDQKRKGYEKNVFSCLDKFFSKAEMLETIIKDELLIRQFKKYFRFLISRILLKSCLISRGYQKPLGYPGDYKIVESMYENKIMSSGFGAVLDEYFLKNEYVQAVRDRKDFMKKYLEKYINKRSDKVMILNLACGSCREIRELLNTDNTILFKKNELIFTFLDQDKMAIDFSKSKISKLPIKIQSRYLIMDFLSYIKSESNSKYNLIYSIGLADYLPDSILGLLFKFSFELLDSGGKIIVAHKNTKRFSSPISDWGADWKFIPRNRGDVIKLIKKYLNLHTNYKINFLKSNSNFLFYVCIIKN